MKKYFTFIISALILSVGMVGCSDKKLSDEEKAKIEEQKKHDANEAVKAILVGKWERQSSVTAAIWKNGNKVSDITDAGMLDEMNNSEEGIPHQLEFKNTEAYFADVNKKRTQDYTIDAKSKTLAFLDDGEEPTRVQYTFSNANKDLTLVIMFRGEGEELGTDTYVTAKFKKVDVWSPQ